ncbi:GntR family transcriptional regulator [Longispora urticae]
MVLHRGLADDLRQAIARGALPVGSPLPTEAELAATHGVSRGTVRHALTILAAEGLISSRQGARHLVRGTERTQSLAELRSFAQWARGQGRQPSGEVLSTVRRPATAREAGLLHLEPGAEVLAVLRLRGLDGEPAMLERTSYAGWIADAVERVDPRADSVTDRLHAELGAVFGHAEHLIDAVAAGVRDAALLGVRRSSPLLRARRVSTTPSGRPVECSDDRYRIGVVTFDVHTTAGGPVLARRAP